MTSPYLPPGPSGPAGSLGPPERLGPPDPASDGTQPGDEPPTQRLFTYPAQQAGPAFPGAPVMSAFSGPQATPFPVPPTHPAPSVPLVTPSAGARPPGTLPFPPVPKHMGPPSPSPPHPGTPHPGVPHPDLPSTGPQFGMPVEVPSARRRSALPWVVAAGFAGLLVIVGTTAVVTYAVTRPSVVDGTDPDVTVLAAAKNSCDPTGAGTTLGDGDRTLLIDTRGEEDPTGIPLSGLACVLDALQAPMYVQEQFDSTRALDGRQQASWGALQASWTYHPDAGLDAIVTLGDG